MARQLQHGGPSSAAQPASASDGAAQPSFLPDGAKQPADESFILMNDAVLQAVRAQLDDPRRKRAHTDARAALNQYANDPRELIVDLARETWWQDYVASQGVAGQMADVGITGFSAAPILGETDPNRDHRTRVDFIVFLADGSYWRLHPGAKKTRDAKPRHITPVSEGNTVLQEHATTPSSNAAQAVLLVPARPSPVPTKPATQQEQQVATPSSSAGQPAPAPALLGSVHQCDIN